MSKRGAGERDFTPAQGNMRKARVEVRRADAFQVLMAAARARNSAAQQQATAVAAATAAGAAAGAAAAPGAPLQSAGLANPGIPPTTTTISPSAPCTHCGTVLPVSANSCSLRQCCACLDVFCSLCSVLDYEEREDRVFCLGCLEDQAATSRGTNPRGSFRAASGGGPSSSNGYVATVSLSLSLSLPLGGPTGRWGQLDMLGGVGRPARSPLPCSRTPQQGHTTDGSSQAPGSAFYNPRSQQSTGGHRGFSALLGYAGAEC